LSKGWAAKPGDGSLDVRKKGGDAKVDDINRKKREESKLLE